MSKVRRKNKDRWRPHRDELPTQPGSASAAAGHWWVRGSPALWLIAATVLCLLPWMNKPFSIDDPLFLWSAERIQRDPMDYYAGNSNWYGTSQPLAEVTMNPPLQCYYLAIVAAIAGFHEVPLHLAMLLPAVAAVLGTYAIARRFCHRPLLATLTFLVTPALLVSSTSLMCDVQMLALWVCALALWLHGIDDSDWRALLGAGLLMGACGLTKYFGICLVPLAAAYAVARHRRLGSWCLWLVIPVAIFAAFEFTTRMQYGQGFILGAAAYATRTSTASAQGTIENLVETFVFFGGALLTLLFFAPWLWSWRTLALWLLAAVVIGGGLLYHGNLATLIFTADGEIDWSALVQATIFCTAGSMIVALAVADVRRRRDPASLVLALWIGGTLVFTACFNWTINVRSILPAAPAAAILVARRLEVCSPAPLSFSRAALRWGLPLGAGLTVSLALCLADYCSARADYVAAEQIADRYGASQRTGDLWLEGHWGLQYYFERRGGKCVDYLADSVEPGDVIVIPDDNTGLKIANADWVTLEEFQPKLLAGLTTFSINAGASFYSHRFGGLPYRLGFVPPRTFRVFMAQTTYRFRDHPDVAAAAKP